MLIRREATAPDHALVLPFCHMRAWTRHVSELVVHVLGCVQEFCAGLSLRNFLTQGYTRGDAGGLAWRRVLTIMRDAAAGLSYVHRKHIGAHTIAS